MRVKSVNQMSLSETFGQIYGRRERREEEWRGGRVGGFSSLTRSYFIWERVFICSALAKQKLTLRDKGSDGLEGFTDPTCSERSWLIPNQRPGNAKRKNSHVNLTIRDELGTAQVRCPG